MAQVNPTEDLLERACDLLVQIAQLHLMSRHPGVISGHVCGVCIEYWPCRTYRYATGDIG